MKSTACAVKFVALTPEQYSLSEGETYIGAENVTFDTFEEYAPPKMEERDWTMVLPKSNWRPISSLKVPFVTVEPRYAATILPDTPIAEPFERPSTVLDDMVAAATMEIAAAMVMMIFFISVFLVLL